MSENLKNLFMGFGVGCRNPKDGFLAEGTETSEALKTLGVYLVDDEDFLHTPYLEFSCHVPGCKFSCDTVIEYEQHYNSCHRFSCSQCSKSLPSSHLLDLHLMELHDAFFSAQAEKKPMFQCFLEECKELFKNGQERRDHCIKMHQFPSNFRFDEARKKKSRKIKPKSNQKSAIHGENSQSVSFNSKGSKGRRKPILATFSKDLRESLPE